MPFFFLKKERKKENDEEWTNKGIFSVAYKYIAQLKATRERVIGPDPQRSYFLEKKKKKKESIYYITA